MPKLSLNQGRYFLKDSIRLEVDFKGSDQSKGIAPPPFQKPYDSSEKPVRLPVIDELDLSLTHNIGDLILNRRSHRSFTKQALTIKELAFLLWATQGVRKYAGPARVYRTVPSAGCRHAFETYLCIQNVESLEPGLYRYLPQEHALLFLRQIPDLSRKIIAATSNQDFVGKASATIIWTAIPYRMEWRYREAAHKVIAIDAGHVCQNLYLASEAIGAGTCAIAAYVQAEIDALVEVDGDEEFVIYLAPVGKVR